MEHEPDRATEAGEECINDSRIGERSMSSDTFRNMIEKAAKSDAYWQTEAKIDLALGIDELMEQRGISKAALAGLVGKSQAYISKALRGDTNFTIDTMVSLVRALGGKLHLKVCHEDHMERDECHQNKFLMADAVNYIRSPEFASLVEHARCYGEIGARMSADGGHRLAEIGPTALLAEISAKYYALVTDAKSWRDIQTYAPGETK